MDRTTLRAIVTLRVTTTQNPLPTNSRSGFAVSRGAAAHNMVFMQSVFDDRPLTDSQMAKLNPTSPLHSIRDAVRATGWETAIGG